MRALRRGTDLTTLLEKLAYVSITTIGRYLWARPEKSSGNQLKS
jgi:hypothetical protein